MHNDPTKQLTANLDGNIERGVFLALDPQHEHPIPRFLDLDGEHDC